MSARRTARALGRGASRIRRSLPSPARSWARRRSQSARTGRRSSVGPRCGCPREPLPRGDEDPDSGAEKQGSDQTKHDLVGVHGPTSLRQRILSTGCIESQNGGSPRGPINHFARGSSSSCSPDDRDSRQAATKNSNVRKATLNASKAWSQESSNPRKHDAANGEDAFVTGRASLRRAARSRLLVDPEDQQTPHDDGAEPKDQRHGESTQRRVGSQGEPREAEPDQADARRDDRAVHEGLEVVASEESLHEGVREETGDRGADQRRPRRARPAEEKDRSHRQTDEDPQLQETLRTARQVHPRMEARAFAPEQRPLQNRHERLRPAVQLDAVRSAR